MARDFLAEIDNNYPIPSSICIMSGNDSIDMRDWCDTVEDFQTAADGGFELRKDGLITYEKTNKRHMVCKEQSNGNFTWEPLSQPSSGGGSTVEIINDLTTGGAGKALSAEQGKVLDTRLKTVENSILKIESPDGSSFLLKVSDDGTLYTEKIGQSELPELPNDFPRLVFKGASMSKDPYFISSFSGPAAKYAFRLNDQCQVTWFTEVGAAHNFRRYRKSNGQIRYCYLKPVTPVEMPETGGHVQVELVVCDENMTVLSRNIMKKHGCIKIDNHPAEQHEYVFIDDNWFILSAYVKREVTTKSGSKRIATTSVLQEIKNGELKLHWDAADHPQDFFIDGQFPDDIGDFCHLNSCIIDPRDKNLIVSLRNISSIFKINRVTGNTIWKLGGRMDEFGMTESQKFLTQHDCKLTSDNTLTLYNNKQGVGSSIMEIGIDEDKKEIKSYQNYTYQNFGGAFMGSVTKIKDKCYAVCWGGSINKPVNTPNIGEYNFTNNTETFSCSYSEGVDMYRTVKGDYVVPSDNNIIDAVSVSITETVQLTPGLTSRLKSTFVPHNTTNKEMSWVSSNEGIATVDKNGVVTAIAIGTATITATTSNSKTSTCSVEVLAEMVDKDIVEGAVLDIRTKGRETLVDRSSANAEVTVLNGENSVVNDEFLFNTADKYIEVTKNQSIEFQNRETFTFQIMVKVPSGWNMYSMLPLLNDCNPETYTSEGLIQSMITNSTWGTGIGDTLGGSTKCDIRPQNMDNGKYHLFTIVKGETHIKVYDGETMLASTELPGRNNCKFGHKYRIMKNSIPLEKYPTVHFKGFLIYRRELTEQEIAHNLDCF